MNVRLVALVFGAFSFGPVQCIASATAILPFTSNGSLGVLNTSGDVVFHTIDGTWTMNGSTFGSGRLVSAGEHFDYLQEQYMAYDFTDILISSGSRVTVDQAAPLILLSVNDAVVNGIIDVNGQSGGSGFMGSGTASLSGAGGGGGGGG